MTNDLERVTRFAKDVDARITILPRSGNPIFEFTVSELLAFEQAVLAKRDENYLTLQEEVEALNGALILSANKVKKLEGDIGVHKFCEVQAVQLSKAHREEIESIQAKLAMQAEAITNADVRSGMIRVREALNATQADVDAFMAKKKAEWEKSVVDKCVQKLINFRNNNSDELFVETAIELISGGVG